MARRLDSNLAQPAPPGAGRRRNPLDNGLDPAMGQLAAVPLAAFAVFAAVGWFGHERVEQARMMAVAEAVLASGYAGPVQVKSMRGDECWRAREGFAWKTTEAAGWACAGPGSELRLRTETSMTPQEGQ